MVTHDIRKHVSYNMYKKTPIKNVLCLAKAQLHLKYK